ncbi:GntR family transcriptional regulator [Mariniradius sediminis]|uniref:GntR family transcriptional regulator n=1 Tax=Mariniradius sediminis TaxID=2909237 RepID=A0ABS9BSW1_9BACT|nr:GntR family transcriptional regulator [Mariniradius sediminis]MCF1750676.1 GntR family transcriptional regulator [Mariniradius sediminis]
MSLDLKIDQQSSVPKYIQVVKSIKSLIHTGELRFGDKIPSINSLSEDYYLSRDTVEKAYTLLRQQGIIESVRGKGFYISHHSELRKYRILLLFNKLSAYKKEIYNALVLGLEDRAEVAFHVYHCEVSLFKKLLEQQKGDFDFYIVMPHFKKEGENAAWKLIQGIPNKKLILLDKLVPGVESAFGAVYQDFKEDIYGALSMLLPRLQKYRRLRLVFPLDSAYPYPSGIVEGFRKFAVEKGFDFDILSEVHGELSLSAGEAYIVIEENDLVRLIKMARENSDLEIGKNFGILSYNETPLKEVLQRGITVMTTDFAKMGEIAAEMVLNNQGRWVKNEFRVIVRESL